MSYTTTFQAIEGYSAMDHYAAEVIRLAQQIVRPAYASRASAKRAGERAVFAAWKQIQPRPSIGPRIDVGAE